jgi:arginase
VETVAVPYHLDQFIPGFDVGVPIDTEIRVDLPDSGTWHRMGILYDHVAQVVSGHDLPVLVVSGDCTTSLGVIAGLQRAGRDPGLVWIDAHGDFNTEATSPSGYLGGLPLALAVGIGTLTLPHELRLRPIPESRAVLVGARDIDRAEARLLEWSQVERRELDLSATDLPQGDLHLHVDIDICDPKLVPDLLFPAPGGPALHDVVAAMRRIIATGRVVAVDLAATWHQNGPAASTQRDVMARIAEAICDRK